MSVITRFPPSPTGLLHIGSARTALFNWLYARGAQGEMVLRIEDTDQQRSTQAAIQNIFESMDWLGLNWDRGPFYQTQRLKRYQQVIGQLLDQKHAYYCYCSHERLNDLRETLRSQGMKPRYDGHCRNLNRTPAKKEQPVIRFRTPGQGTVVFEDLIRGRVEVNNQELDDLIIARSDGYPTYNLTVVIDDIDMKISHVIRGDDHINNTPRQINIFKALKKSLPKFAHVPMILGKDGRRLSKRNGDASVLEYREMGILPEALLNYLVRLGWSHRDQEIFSKDAMIELFKVENVNHSPAIFDMKKLLWMNRHYIAHCKNQQLVEEVERIMTARGVKTNVGPKLSDVVEIMRGRVQTLVEIADQISFFYCPVSEYDLDAIRLHVNSATPAIMRSVHTDLANLNHWSSENIGNSIRKKAGELGVKFAQIAQPLRISVSGSVNTPSIDLTLELVGRDATLEQIEDAITVFTKNI